jgi:DNA-binding transcriptional regulator LsrR (DeoR family)
MATKEKFQGGGKPPHSEVKAPRTEVEIQDDPNEEIALICTVTQRFLESVKAAGNGTASMRKLVRTLAKEDPARYGRLTPQRAYKCLQEAFAGGYLQFFPPTNHRLQTWLETRFPHLDSATVVDSVEMAHLAGVAARKIQRLILNASRGRKGDAPESAPPLVVGVGGGHTVHEVMSRLDLSARDDQGDFVLPRVRLVGLTSGFDPSDCSTVPNYLLGMMARRHPGRVEQCGLFAPGLVERSLLKDVRNWPGTREAVAQKDRLDVIVSGLGSALDEGSVFWSFVRDRLGAKPQADPRRRAVGDMLFGCYNALGEPIDMGLDLGMTAVVDLSELRRFARSGKTRVVTVVGRRPGDRRTKAESLLAALRGEFFDTLVTDLATAREVQELDAAG